MQTDTHETLYPYAVGPRGRIRRPRTGGRTRKKPENQICLHPRFAPPDGRDPLRRIRRRGGETRGGALRRRRGGRNGPIPAGDLRGRGNRPGGDRRDGRRQRPHPQALRSGEDRHRPTRRRLGALPDPDRRQSPAGHPQSPRHRGQRPPRRGLRAFHALGADRRIPLVLVGRRPGEKTCGAPCRRPADLLPDAVGALPRHLPQRRGLGSDALGLADLRARARQHRPQNLRQGLRTAAAPQGQLPRPGHAPRFHLVQPNPRKQARSRHVRHRDGIDPLRTAAAEHRQRMGYQDDGALELRQEQGGYQPRAHAARAREQPLRERLYAGAARPARRRHVDHAAHARKGADAPAGAARPAANPRREHRPTGRDRPAGVHTLQGGTGDLFQRAGTARRHHDRLAGRQLRLHETSERRARAAAHGALRGLLPCLLPGRTAQLPLVQHDAPVADVRRAAQGL